MTTQDKNCLKIKKEKQTDRQTKFNQVKVLIK